MFTFNHSGKLGDILFSLYFCKEYANSYGEDKFNYHIQTNVVEGNGLIGMSENAVKFIKPLLESQEYINEVTWGDNIREDNTINLMDFKELTINIFGGDIRSWYYNLVSNHLPKEFWKPIIKVEPNYKIKDKIILTWTHRYQNVYIDYNCLQEFKDNLIFIGVKDEIDEFCKKYFNVQYLPCSNMLQMTQYFAGAGGFVGNQSGNWALAECLKIPRILISPDWLDLPNEPQNPSPGTVNNHPVGGWCECADFNGKLYFSVKSLVDYVKEKNSHDNI